MTEISTSGGPRGLLSAFDTVRIISLPARTDRRRSVASQLAKLGATIDARHIAFQDAVRPSDAGGFETIGARGCFLSHLEALKTARQVGAVQLLILEDDVGFSRTERAAMPVALSALAQHDWDVLYGGSPVQSAGCPLTAVAPETPLMLAHFIGFSASAVDRLIPFLEAMIRRPTGSLDGGPMHVDGAYNWFRNANPDMKAFAATPHVAHQTASRTDIHHLGRFDRIKAFWPMLGLVRAGRNMLRQRD